MKVLGILSIGMVSGLASAAANLGTGGSLWTALLYYTLAGVGFTIVAALVLIWRALEAERPASQLVMSTVSPGVAK